jgi:FkbM family methyltransferase
MRDVIRQSLRRLGYDLHRFLPVASPDAALQKALSHFRIDLVLDVGANAGQFGTRLRALGYAGDIVSFEPLAEAHARLQATARVDPRWQAAPRAAIGDHEGTIAINVAGNSTSSSVLDMLESHRTATPESAYVGKENVAITRLDKAAAPFIGQNARLYLKIDTQGFEAQVIAGARQTLARAAAVQLEMSLAPLYAGQPDFTALMQQMAGMGFTLWGLWPGYVDEASGRLLQIDTIYAQI